MAAGIKSFSKTFVWIILGLLIAGLAGFGATNLSGTVRTVGTVGDQTISVDSYARELQREIRALEAQTGQPLPMEQVQTLGLDRAVLSRLVSLAALDNEVADLGLSVGDENLHQEIVEIAAFQGVDGKFDREAYRFALSQAGIDEAEFESDLRAESARTLVQGAIISGVKMPEVLIDTLTDYVAARRNFTWISLGPDNLTTAIPTPTEEDLRAHYDANPDIFTLPATKRLSYALLTPDMILDQVEVDEAALRQLYEQRARDFILPERRLVERLAFADEAAASEAMAQLEVGGTTFEALVEQRGLTLADVDLGDVTAADLGAAAEPVFAAESGEVVGPLPSPLGAALFRVNGILAARTTSFEDASADLRDELAGDRARRQIEIRAQAIDDLLAGGATLEDLAKETEMEFGQIDWTPQATDDVAAYPAFRDAAAAVTEDDFPTVTYLEDGGIFALRLDEELPSRPEPFESARERVRADWLRKRTRQALREQAETLKSELAESGDFTATGLPVHVENGLTRAAFVEGTSPDFIEQVFATDPGEYRVIDGDQTMTIVRVDDELPPDDTADLASMRTAFGTELDQSLAQALFDAFVTDARLRANPQLDQRALNAVQASFR